MTNTMSDSIEKLSFSEEALSNRSLFLSNLNQINIYVEDTDKEYIYEEIFERLFEDNITFFCIFPLGGKTAVLNKHKKTNMYEPDGKANIFIVDGDFDNLWDEQKTISPNLIYLERYNIESYYCKKESTIKYMRSVLKRQRKPIEELIKYDEWMQSFRNEAGKLFILFALVQHNCPSIPNVNLCSDFLDVNGQLIEEEYQKYENQIIDQVGTLEYLLEEIKQKIHCQFTGDEENKIFSIICGKYQIESLCRHLQKCSGKNICREVFYNNLISNFDLEPLKFLKERIMNMISNETHSQNSA